MISPAFASSTANFRGFFGIFANNPLQDWGEEGEDSFTENKGVLSQNRASAIPQVL